MAKYDQTQTRQNKRVCVTFSFDLQSRLILYYTAYRWGIVRLKLHRYRYVIYSTVLNMAYGPKRQLVFVGLTTYVFIWLGVGGATELEEGHGDGLESQEDVACRLTALLQRPESISYAYIDEISNSSSTGNEHDIAVTCRLETPNEGTRGYVKFWLVDHHELPTELRVTMSESLRAELEALTMICQYANIAPELYFGNKIPDSVQQSDENGVYECGEGTNFRIVLTGLVENAKRRSKRYTENIVCSNVGNRPEGTSIPENLNNKPYWFCDMYNATRGVIMFTEHDGFQCSRCCKDHVFDKASWICKKCPPNSHKDAYNYHGECDPVVITNVVQVTPEPPKQSSIEFKSPVNVTETFIALEWTVSGLSASIDHFRVDVKKEGLKVRSNKTPDTYVNISDLSSDTFYHITVSAVSRQKGDVLKSKTQMVQTWFVIPKVKDLNVTLLKDEVLVTWTPHAEHQLMIAINCSFLESERVCNKDTVGYENPDSDGRFTFKLSCRGKFNIRAHYYDVKYKRHGPLSDNFTRNFIEKEKPLFAPTELSYENLETTSARIIWEKVPSTEGNPIKNYAVYVKEEKSGTEFKFFTKDNETCWHELGSLIADTMYEVHVTAVNDQGEGPPSKVLPFQTLFEMPKMKGVSVNRTYANINVTWNPQEKYNLSVKITSKVEDGTMKIFNASDKDGELVFMLEATGNYSINVSYFDEINNRTGPSYEDQVYYAATSWFGFSILVAIILVCVRAAVLLIGNCINKLVERMRNPPY